MITCYLRYVIDPYKLNEFEKYGKMWIPLVKNLVAPIMDILCLMKVQVISLLPFLEKDPECKKAFTYANETRCIISYERSFMKPIFE